MSYSFESRLIQAMVGKQSPSILMSDAYKFSMAQAGFPLRTESFYLSFRKAGWYFLPFDMGKLVKGLCPALPRDDEREFLNRHGFGLNCAMEAALEEELSVWAAPKGSWIAQGEPIVRISGPSFLVSWLEPLVIALNFPIQLASLALQGMLGDTLEVPCGSLARIAEIVFEAIEINSVKIRVREEFFRAEVSKRAAAIVASLNGEAERVFELGMRSAPTVEMHRIALEEIRDMGVEASSSLYLSKILGMTPVGTTGHEHQQRWGRDESGFRAVRDMRKQGPSYLVDTYDALKQGIPAALKVLRETPGREASLRFDSGAIAPQLEPIVASGLEPTLVFMDGMNEKKISDVEKIASGLGINASKRLYGIGGHWVGSVCPSGIHRNSVAAVFKLSLSGTTPVMKFSVPGKESIPGKPVIFRRQSGNGPEAVIGQEGEHAPDGYTCISQCVVESLPPCNKPRVDLSRASQLLLEEARRRSF